MLDQEGVIYPWSPLVFGVHPVLIAPNPLFTRLSRDYEMVLWVALEMLGGMLIGRRIAAKGDATGLAGAQVDPVITRLYTFCAFVSLGFE